MNAQAYQFRSDSLIDLQMRTAESSELSEIEQKCFERDGNNRRKFDKEALKKLTPAEYSRISRFYLSNLFRLDNLLKQYELGFLDDDYYEIGISPIIQDLKPVWDAFGFDYQQKYLLRRFEAVENKRKKRGLSA